MEKKLGPENMGAGAGSGSGAKPSFEDMLSPMVEPSTKNIFAKKLLNKKAAIVVKEERKQEEPEEPVRPKNVFRPPLSLNVEEANGEVAPAEEDCMAEDFEGENIRNEPVNQK